VKKPETSVSNTEKDDKSKRSGKRSQASSSNFDEMDEDEMAMAREADDDDNKAQSVLLKQPSCITGGTMR
jgi:hypothetical protein